MIKAIETRYAGYLFRSRLEARWACFFDALGIRWEYEKEGYDLGEAGWYLPDFWLPGQQCFVEIKGAECSDKDRAKCAALNEQSGYSVFIAVGNIGDHDWIEFGGYTTTKPVTLKYNPFETNPLQCPRCGIAYVRVCELDSTQHHRHSIFMECENGHTWELVLAFEKGKTDFGFKDLEEHCSFAPDKKWEHDQDKLIKSGLVSSLQDAIAAARSAQFEHGRSGAR